MAFTNDYILTEPDGSEPASTIDDIIKELKVATDERMVLEHYFASDGSSTETDVTAQGRHKPGYVGVLLYDTYATITAIVGTGGQIAYSTTTPVGFLHYVVGSGWQALSWNSDDIVADDITLELTGGSPSVLQMKHNNQQWTTTFALTEGPTINTDCDQSNSFSVTLAGDRILAAPTNQKPGATYMWIITQPVSGGPWSLTFDPVFKFTGGVAPDLTAFATSTAKVDIISGISDGTNIYCGVLYDLK